MADLLERLIIYNSYCIYLHTFCIALPLSRICPAAPFSAPLPPQKKTAPAKGEAVLLNYWIWTYITGAGRSGGKGGWDLPSKSNPAAHFLEGAAAHW